jgi:Eukaryotic-type carbonic anhydrase
LRSRQDAGTESIESVSSASAAYEAAQTNSIPPGAKVTTVNNKRFLLREENFRESTEGDQEYFDRVYADFKHREMQAADALFELDYEDVPYWPYEWLVKVETEYYFRYEGTMIVPPCWEVVHWRTMKDPIRVHKRQIEELNRLLAWRIAPSPSCEPDTAGRVSRDGNRVDLNRDTQYIHLQHRLVFCECKDWPSKFPSDKEWCTDWKEGSAEPRFYERPYSFDSNGEW